LSRLADRRLPTLTNTRDVLVTRSSKRENLLTQTLTTMKRRPWLAPAAAAGLAALLLFVPVSYQTTTGYDVKLEIDGTGGTASPGPLVADFAKALSTDHAAVSLSLDGARTVIMARVMDNDRSGVEQRAAAFAARLSGTGLSSRISLAPVMEMTTSPVYARGLGGFRLDIQRKGRHSGDVERDIEAQLRQAHIAEADVSYSEKDGCSLIQIVMPGDGSTAAENTSGGLHVALICAATDADCKRKCAERPDCATTRSTGASAGGLQVSLDGETGYVCSGEVTLQSTAGLTDDQIAEAIRSKFQAQGCQTDVVVRNGSVVSVDPKCGKN
jgi:hypothetical protein